MTHGYTQLHRDTPDIYPGKPRVLQQHMTHGYTQLHRDTPDIYRENPE